MTNSYSERWKNLKWKKLRQNLFRLQRRLWKAIREGDRKRAVNLQKLILKSRSARLLAIRQVTQLNQVDVLSALQGGENVKWIMPRLYPYEPTRLSEAGCTETRTSRFKWEVRRIVPPIDSTKLSRLLLVSLWLVPPRLVVPLTDGCGVLDWRSKSATYWIYVV